MYKIENYIGKKVTEYVTVVGIDKEFEGKTYNANHWIFKCDCGVEFSEIPSRVLSGHKKSCGCKKHEGSLIHGCNKNEFYPTWWGMMQRCYNKENHNYQRYGGRGITVCEEWHDPKEFIKWAKMTIGHKRKDLTLDRRDNNKGYSPENCRWATSKEQSINKSNTRYETINGETKPLKTWCDEYGIEYYLVLLRCNDLGWDVKDALTTPKNSKNPNKKVRLSKRRIKNLC